MKRLPPTLVLGRVLVLSLSIAVSACGKKEGDSAKPAASSPFVTSMLVPNGASSAAASSPHAGKPGEVPFAFPIVATTAKVDDYVLAPQRSWIDAAFQKGPEQQPFIYYGARMVEPGPAESTLKTLKGEVMKIPNSMIIPLRTSETVKPGDVLLTWWQAASGMQRSIVVGGTETEPKVRHLDIDFESPGGGALRDDTLRHGSFQKLTGDWEPGVSVAVKDGAGYRHGIITAVDGDRLLIVGFGGRMRALSKADCVRLPVSPTVKAGATVFVPHVGVFVKGVVEKVDAAVGRVVTKFQAGGATKIAAVAVTNVAPTLPGL